MLALKLLSMLFQNETCTMLHHKCFCKHEHEKFVWYIQKREKSVDLGIKQCIIECIIIQQEYFGNTMDYFQCYITVSIHMY